MEITENLRDGETHCYLNKEKTLQCSRALYRQAICNILSSLNSKF